MNKENQINNQGEDNDINMEEEKEEKNQPYSKYDKKDFDKEKYFTIFYLKIVY